jgi:hypothetical protein
LVAVARPGHRIRKVVSTLEGINPQTQELGTFWRQAIDVTKLWLEAIDR